MIESTFKAGNYNEWDNLITNIIPNKNIVLRQEIIPLIDNILLSMLGPSCIVEKTNIDVEQICERQKGITGIIYRLTYTVDDFKVNNAPPKAVETDTEAIRNALFREDFHIKNVKIDTNNGTLFLEFETYLEG